MYNETKIRLSKEQEEILRNLDNEIRIAEAEIQRAKGLGIDVSDLERQLEEAKRLRDMLLKEYGSGA